MYRILIVEDDYLQVDLIKTALQKEPDFSPAKATIDRISTERQFHTRFEEIKSNPPDVIIMDVMLRWDDPAPKMEPPPPEIKRRGFYRAGLRNEEMLALDEKTRDIPVILYTLLEDIDLKEMPERSKLRYLPKDSSLDPLVQLVRALIVHKSD
jgi:CheY-like chemotaxis protein